MLWFAALVFLILTAPFWVPLLLGAVGLVLTVALALAVLAIAPIVGMNIASDFGLTQAQGAAAGIAVDLVGLFWAVMANGPGNRRVRPSQHLVDLHYSSQTEYLPPKTFGGPKLDHADASAGPGGLAQLQNAIDLHRQEETSEQEKLEALRVDILRDWEQAGPQVLRAISAVSQVLVARDLPPLELRIAPQWWHSLRYEPRDPLSFGVTARFGKDDFALYARITPQRELAVSSGFESRLLSPQSSALEIANAMSEVLLITVQNHLTE